MAYKRNDVLGILGVRHGSKNNACSEAGRNRKDSEGRGHIKDEEVVQVIQTIVLGSTKCVCSVVTIMLSDIKF
jgi:CO dehydrogenase/acetyl-CoA synthase alpha subunit